MDTKQMSCYFKIHVNNPSLYIKNALSETKDKIQPLDKKVNFTNTS